MLTVIILIIIFIILIISDNNKADGINEKKDKSSELSHKKCPVCDKTLTSHNKSIASFDGYTMCKNCERKISRTSFVSV